MYVGISVYIFLIRDHGYCSHYATDIGQYISSVYLKYLRNILPELMNYCAINPHTHTVCVYRTTTYGVRRTYNI